MAGPGLEEGFPNGSINNKGATSNDIVEQTWSKPIKGTNTSERLNSINSDKKSKFRNTNRHRNQVQETQHKNNSISRKLLFLLNSWNEISEEVRMRIVEIVKAEINNL